MAKFTKNAKVFSHLISSFAFLAIGILILPPAAWSDCTSCGNCPPPVIGFTSKQMSVNGNQTLTAIGGIGPYTWSLVSGGGNLPGSGTSVTYTAPGSNANCTNNPTIQVTDYCGNTTTLKIAINAYNQDIDAYYTTHVIKDVPNCGTYITNNFYRCDGTPGQQDWGGCSWSCVKTCNGFCCVEDSLTSCTFNPECGGECPGCNPSSPNPWCCQGAKNDCTSDSYIESACPNSCGRAGSGCPHNCHPFGQPNDMRGPTCENILQYGCCPAALSTCVLLTEFNADVNT